MGGKQGDPLSSFLFNVDMNSLCTDLINDHYIDPPYIGDVKVPCLVWADDVVLITKSEEGLKSSLTNFGKILLTIEIHSKHRKNESFNI